MIGMHPAEVVIRTLRVEPVVLTREQRQALPVMRLIDALGILVGLRAKIGEPAVHERLWRAHHRDGQAQSGESHSAPATPGTAYRNTGFRAAVTSSRRRSGVLRGASRTAAGSVFTRSAIRSIAAANASSVSRGSVSVGSIIIASGTMSGKYTVGEWKPSSSSAFERSSADAPCLFCFEALRTNSCIGGRSKARSYAGRSKASR